MSILIALEGLDGSGKSTLAEKLVTTMSADPAFYPWIYQSGEPGSKWTGVGPELRKLVLETPDFRPFERELLFYVDASLHARFIDNQGSAIIVSDRGVWTHLAYLRGYLKTKQVDYDQYLLGKEVINKVCRTPDCVVYIDSDLELMKERLAGKKKDLIEKNGDAYFEAVLETYKDLMQEAERTGQKVVKLSARDSIDNNIMQVVNYLKGAFTNEELREGDRRVCRV